MYCVLCTVYYYSYERCFLHPLGGLVRLKERLAHANTVYDVAATGAMDAGTAAAMAAAGSTGGGGD